MKLPSAGTHHSKSGDKGTVPAGLTPEEPQKDAVGAEGRGGAGLINVPSLAPAGDSTASLAEAVALANLPPEPDAALAALAPKRRQRSFWARLSEGVSNRPSFWVEMGVLLLLALICLVITIVSLFLPTNGIQRSQAQPAAVQADSVASGDHQL
jgi:hypothetical protein